MYESELPLLRTEDVGGLGIHLDRRDESIDTFCHAIADNLYTPENLDSTTEAANEHIKTLSNVICYILEDYPEESPDAKASIITNVLDFDNRVRIKFLQFLSGEDETEKYEYGNPDFRVMFERVKVSVENHLLYQEPAKVSARDILAEHVNLLNKDMNIFLQSDFFKARLESYQQQRQKLERRRHVLATAAGTAIGGILAGVVWQKLRKII